MIGKQSWLLELGRELGRRHRAAKKCGDSSRFVDLGHLRRGDFFFEGRQNVHPRMHAKSVFSKAYPHTQLEHVIF